MESILIIKSRRIGSTTAVLNTIQNDDSGYWVIYNDTHSPHIKNNKVIYGGRFTSDSLLILRGRHSVNVYIQDIYARDIHSILELKKNYPNINCLIMDADLSSNIATIENRYDIDRLSLFLMLRNRYILLNDSNINEYSVNVNGVSVKYDDEEVLKSPIMWADHLIASLMSSRNIILSSIKPINKYSKDIIHTIMESLKNTKTIRKMNYQYDNYYQNIQ